MNSRIYGSLLGVIVGDLLGEQVEGCANPGLIQSFQKDAKYTDDTEMTLITLDHLIRFKTIKPISLTLEYAANADFSRKYGGNCRNTLKEIRKNPDKWDSATSEFSGPEGSWGNGCLMRVSPIAVFQKDPIIMRQLLYDCLLGTHNNEESLNCAMEYCLFLQSLLDTNVSNLNPDQLLKSTINRNLNPRLTDKLKLLQSIEDPWDLDIIKTIINPSIRASDTLALIIAVFIFHLKMSIPPTEVLSLMISVGGDTDTNAAIIGSLLGALYGIDWIKSEWFENIEDRVNILSQLKKFLYVSSLYNSVNMN